MITSISTILPPSLFDGLSTLWGACAYIGASIVGASLAFGAFRSRSDPGDFIWTFVKTLMIGIATICLREWLMRLSDVVISLAAMLNIDPTAVDEQFVRFVAGKSSSGADASVWDVIWGTKSIGTAICYAFLWLFGWMAWGIQYIVKLVGDLLLIGGWSLSPIFLSFFAIRSLSGIAHKYVLGLIGLVFWPFGWVLAAVVTKAMLDAAATANLMPVFVATAPVAAPALTVLLIGSWMLISSVLAPWITTRILMNGANPAAVMAASVGSVFHAAVSSGFGAAVAASTAGLGGAGVAGATLGGLLSGATESSARGGASARLTNTTISGLSGLTAGKLMRRHAAAAEDSAVAQQQNAEASESFVSTFTAYARQQSQKKSGFSKQPHTEDPNSSAIEIESHDKSKP